MEWDCPFEILKALMYYSRTLKSEKWIHWHQYCIIFPRSFAPQRPLGAVFAFSNITQQLEKQMQSCITNVIIILLLLIYINVTLIHSHLRLLYYRISLFYTKLKSLDCEVSAAQVSCWGSLGYLRWRKATPTMSIEPGLVVCTQSDLKLQEH